MNGLTPFIVTPESDDIAGRLRRRVATLDAQIVLLSDALRYWSVVLETVNPSLTYVRAGVEENRQATADVLAYTKQLRDDTMHNLSRHHSTHGGSTGV